MKKILLLLALFSSIQVFAQKDTITSEADWPLGMAEKDGILYIAEADANAITTLDLYGSSQTTETFLNDLGRPNHLAFYGDYLYFSEFGSNQISRVDITATDPTPEVVATDIVNARHLLLIGDELYYSDFNSISKLDLLSSNPVPVMVADIGTFSEIAHYGDHLYFSAFTLNELGRINLLETDPVPEVLLTGLGGPLGGIEIFGNDLYIGLYNNYELVKVDLSATNLEVVVVDDNVRAIGDVMVVGNTIYVTSFELGAIYSYGDVIISHTNDLILKDMEVYPNPTADIININLNKNEKVNSITLYNTVGALVKSIPATATSVDISDLPKGYYMLKVEGDDWKAVEKITRL